MREHHVLLRLVLLVLLLYALANYTAARWELSRQQADTRQLEGRKQELLAQRQELEERLRAIDDPAQLRRLAWEKLRMVSPGERVFTFTEAAASDDP